jgi:hypothetical protein
MMSPSAINLCLNLQGNTALMRATSSAVVEYLLEQRADTHRVDTVSYYMVAVFVA